MAEVLDQGVGLAADAAGVPIPELDIDPFSVDPCPVHARLRDTGPVVRLPRYDILAVARHADAYAVRALSSLPLELVPA